MLEAVLEQLLLRFLAPYLDGISKDKLHLGVLSGLLELKDLRVKADALALLGNPTLRIKTGKVGRLRLHVPWTHLYSGKLRVSIETVHFEVERIGDESSDKAPPSDTEVVQQLREAKQKAIALRATQLQDLVKQREEEESEGEEDEEFGDSASPMTKQKKEKRQGLIAKLVRKIVNNVQVDLSDLEASYCSPSFGIACGVSLRALDVVSTDSKFRDPQQDGGGEVVVLNGALYKLLRLRQFSCRMAPVGVSELAGAAYVLHPVSAKLQLAHEPHQGLLQTKFEVAHEDILELTIVRSQLKHLRGAQAERGKEFMRLYRLMVPEADEASLFKSDKTAQHNLQEYAMLYERKLIFEEGLEGTNDEPLAKREMQRLQLLEDALAIGLLARRQVLVRQRIDLLREDIERRQRSTAEGIKQSAAGGTFSALSSWWGNLGVSKTSGDAGQHNLLYSPSDVQRLGQDLEDESKFEDVDVPKRMRFEFTLGMCALDMIDDRWSREDQRQVLSLAMEQACVSFSLTSSTDYHGREMSEWRLEMTLGTFHAFQAAHVAFRFCPGPGRHGNSPPQLQGRESPEKELADGEAAKLVIASELGSNKYENVMKLIFKFAPTEIHMPRGLVEEVRELLRVDLPPEPAVPPVAKEVTLREVSSPASRLTRVTTMGTLRSLSNMRSLSDLDDHARREKVGEILTDHFKTVVGNRVRAHTLAQKVADKIPDKLEIDVRIASPIFHVPIPSQGTTIFSLGCFHLQTPAPCEYSNLDMDFRLDDMVFYAKTIRGERFDVFKPVHFNCNLKYKSNADGSELGVIVKVEKAGMTLVPQSLQMLMATPFAMASVLWGKEEKQDKKEPEPREQPAEDPGAATAEGADEAAAASPSEQQEEQRSEVEISEVIPEVPQAPLRQFIFSATVQFDALDLTLADSVVPVMVWHMRWAPPGLEIYRVRLPQPTMNIDINFAVEVEILNPRNNAWEPFVEHFHGRVSVLRESLGDSRRMEIQILARDELSLNLKPTMLQRFLWFTPLFLTGLTFEENLVVTSSDGATANVLKYRVVNLSSQTLEIEFKSCHRANLRTEITPTGSKWEHIDKWVVSPYFATALVVRLPGGQFSEQLSLEHDGAVTILDSGLVAELLTPSPEDRMQHRMLLIGSPLRVHNQTDLPLVVRFHSDLLIETRSETRSLKKSAIVDEKELLSVPLPPTVSCDGDLLGYFSQEFVDTDFAKQPSREEDEQHSNVLILQPNAVMAVPVAALFREQGADVGISHAFISARPALAGFAFCGAVKVGAETPTQTLHCKRAPAADTVKAAEHKLRNVHLICESRAEKVQWPRPSSITTVVIQPALSLLNALPFGDLVIGYGPKAAESPPEESWQEARVPHLRQMNVYNFPGNLLQDGISLRARLSRGGCWSTLHHFGHGDLKEGGASRVMDLRMRSDGAAAGMVIEHTDGFRLRFSCPFWFVDRSGFAESVGLQIMHKGRPLPVESGITLLHDKCLEEDCQLVAKSSTAVMDCSQVMMASGFDFCTCSSTGIKLDRTAGTVSYTLKLPPNFSILNLNTLSYKAGVFCLQADDVNKKDMLGAECQVLTLRPRLILTNTSAYEIEIMTGERECFCLEPGSSKELHWTVRRGEEDSPSTTLQFRPLCFPPCQWSDDVICSDAAAGSKAYYLLVKPGSRADAVGRLPSSLKPLGAGVPQVWSADVAPTRGALAVSFRSGSDFVAVNRATNVNLIIRPLDKHMTDDLTPLADIAVEPNGEPVPLGWAKPFKPDHAYAVDAVISGRTVRIEDIRRTRRKVISGVYVTIARVGTQTIVSIEDTEPEEEGGKDAQNISSSMKFELKLNRLGISLIDEVPVPRELLFVHMDLIRLEWYKDTATDTKRIKFVISDVQVDCQLPGRADASRANSSEDKPEKALPAVVLANCDIGDRMFLKLLIEQGATSSADIMIPQAEIALDRLDISIDDGWVEALVGFVRQCRSGKDTGARLEAMLKTAGHSAALGYSPPPLPSVVQVEKLHVDAIKFTLWCRLKLRSCGFLPAYLRDALRVLSFSDELTLEDATLSLPERSVPMHRGSLRDFLRGLAVAYTLQIFTNIGVALGKSSLLNLPRAPLRIGGTTVSFLSDTMGLVAGEAASLMNHLTFDREYVARQRLIRSQKQITGLQDGLQEAGRSLGQGLEGVLDVVKKPAQGWQEGGFKGAVFGIGQGVASGFVKPLSNLGQAISDVGAGISAAVNPISVNVQRRRARRRQRLPRLLFSDGGAIRPWSEVEAELLWQLGSQRMRGIQEVLCINREGVHHWVLLLYTYHLELVELTVEERQGGSSGMGASSSVAPPRGASLGVIDDATGATEKIFWQAVKPITKLVHSMKELNKASSSSQREGVDLRLDFGDLRKVQLSEVDAPPFLELFSSSGVALALPLDGGELGPMSLLVAQGLADGFRSALTHAEGAANWGILHMALREEHLRQQEDSAVDLLRENSEGVQLTLEVFEVERWMVMSNEWQTPSLPTDSHLKWRWVDATGQKHPHLQRLPMVQIAARKTPPIELDTMFETAGEWTIVQNEGTENDDGWTYGISFRSSTWNSTPDLFDVLRRRRWQRTFR